MKGVPVKSLGRLSIAIVLVMASLAAPLNWAQNTPAPLSNPGQGDPAASRNSAEALYTQLGKVGLDSSRVYNIRDVTLDREALHITFNDGTIAFTEDVEGRITGAFFEGEGEV